ncbi:HEAT repeat domain-containing protein [Blastopirellula marina]|uniref:HEAT repeat domain-containing protein n=1 Tax=Blastopirellula marina TaxID=124 RepID=A0A2S8GKA7_9BACT|nr:hypothetical protein [Blastopirellula marina]PQO44879.1 hypothetical protein C5Y93_17465 [Blastopirellula marina]
MNTPISISQQLAELSQLRDDLRTPEAKAQLKSALANASNRIVERAAELIAEAEDASLTPDLVKAYRRLKRNPLKKDPGCLAKQAIVKALIQVGYTDPEFFREGIVYEQVEPYWGGQIDTAAEIRGDCAIGLAHCIPVLELLNHCAKLLADEYVEARMGAAQALGALGQPEAGPLLRLKLLAGNETPEVHGECCSALLKIDPLEGLEFIKPFLASENADQCVQTALAVGESKLPGAFDLLRNTWGRRSELNVRESLLLCVGLLRTTESQDFLLSLIDTRDLRTAADAINAIKLNGEVGEIHQRTEAAVEKTGSEELRQVFLDE